VSPLHPKVKLVANEEEWLRSRPMTVRCAECGWTLSGTFAETQAAFREHRANAHGVAVGHDDER
jgi:hypothetical protein